MVRPFLLHYVVGIFDTQSFVHPFINSFICVLKFILSYLISFSLMNKIKKSWDSNKEKV